MARCRVLTGVQRATGFMRRGTSVSENKGVNQQNHFLMRNYTHPGRLTNLNSGTQFKAHDPWILPPLHIKNNFGEIHMYILKLFILPTPKFASSNLKPHFLQLVVRLVCFLTQKAPFAFFLQLYCNQFPICVDD